MTLYIKLQIWTLKTFNINVIVKFNVNISEILAIFETHETNNIQYNQNKFQNTFLTSAVKNWSQFKQTKNVSKEEFEMALMHCVW